MIALACLLFLTAEVGALPTISTTWLQFFSSPTTETTCRPLLLNHQTCAIDSDEDGEQDLFYSVYKSEREPERTFWIRASSGGTFVDADHDGQCDWGELRLPQNSKLLFYLNFSNNRPGVILFRNQDGDALSLHTTDYTYEQSFDQWNSDFSGENDFYILIWDETRGEFRPLLESPFCFESPLRNGRSQMALRLSTDLEATPFYNSFRLSYDVDGDGSPYDYDLSITGLGLVEVPTIPDESVQVDGVTLPLWSSCRSAKRMARQGFWHALNLVWDDGDENYAHNDSTHTERWEGVINFKFKDFPQVGGPASHALNKRSEIAFGHNLRGQLYYSVVDHAFHLHRATVGLARFDLDRNGLADVNYSMSDTNQDGFFDEWHWDFDGDSISDYRVQREAHSKVVPLDYGTLRRFVKRHERRARRELTRRYQGQVKSLGYDPCERQWRLTGCATEVNPTRELLHLRVCTAYAEYLLRP